MTNSKRRLVLKVVRFQNACDAIEQSAAECYAMDRQFDGGEFSGPAIDRQVTREMDRAARRLGFANAEAAYDVVQFLHAGLSQPTALMMGEQVPLPL